MPFFVLTPSLDHLFAPLNSLMWAVRKKWTPKKRTGNRFYAFAWYSSTGTKQILIRVIIFTEEEEQDWEKVRGGLTMKEWERRDKEGEKWKWESKEKPRNLKVYRITTREVGNTDADAGKARRTKREIKFLGENPRKWELECERKMLQLKVLCLFELLPIWLRLLPFLRFDLYMIFHSVEERDSRWELVKKFSLVPLTPSSSHLRIKVIFSNTINSPTRSLWIWKIDFFFRGWWSKTNGQSWKRAFLLRSESPKETGWIFITNPLTELSIKGLASCCKKTDA